MLTLGPVSSLFDLLTFGLLFALFGDAPELFHTGWFVESMATQVLVVFVIRTARNPLKSRPHPSLVLSSLSVVTLAAILPFTPVAATLGFVPLPASFVLPLLGLVAAYLALTQFVKARWLAT